MCNYWKDSEHNQTYFSGVFWVGLKYAVLNSTYQLTRLFRGCWLYLLKFNWNFKMMWHNLLKTSRWVFLSLFVSSSCVVKSGKLQGDVFKVMYWDILKDLALGTELRAEHCFWVYCFSALSLSCSTCLQGCLESLPPFVEFPIPTCILWQQHEIMEGVGEGGCCPAAEIPALVFSFHNMHESINKDYRFVHKCCVQGHFLDTSFLGER